MDPPELEKARRFMQEKIFQFLAQRQPQTNDIPRRKFLDLVKRLEEGLFRTAETQEEYLNLDTLESRLHVIVNRPQMCNNNPQRSQFVNSSAPLGTMIPTPGMPQHGNSNMLSSSLDNSSVSASTCNNISSSAGNSAYLLPTENGSSSGMHGVSAREEVGASIEGLAGAAGGARSLIYDGVKEGIRHDVGHHDACVLADITRAFPAAVAICGHATEEEEGGTCN